MTAMRRDKCLGVPSVSVTKRRTKTLKPRGRGAARFIFGASVPYRRQTTLSHHSVMQSVNSSGAQTPAANTGKSTASTKYQYGGLRSSKISKSLDKMEAEEPSLSLNSMESDDSDLETRPETTVVKTTPTYLEMEIASSEVRDATLSASGPTGSTTGSPLLVTRAPSAGLVMTRGTASSQSGTSSGAAKLPNFLAQVTQ